MAPHSNTLAWKIPWMEEPGGLQSMGSLRSVLAWRIPGMGEPWWAAVYGVTQSRTRLKQLSSSRAQNLLMLSFTQPSMYEIQRRQWHPTPVLLPGKSHGRRSLVGYSPCGC